LRCRTPRRAPAAIRTACSGTASQVARPAAETEPHDRPAVHDLPRWSPADVSAPVWPGAPRLSVERLRGLSVATRCSPLPPPAPARHDPDEARGSARDRRRRGTRRGGQALPQPLQRGATSGGPGLQAAAARAPLRSTPPWSSTHKKADTAQHDPRQRISTSVRLGTYFVKARISQLNMRTQP